jgi:hypothetical protein
MLTTREPWKTTDAGRTWHAVPAFGSASMGLAV